VRTVTEKPVALRDAHSASLESLSLYLSGQWPKDSQKKGDINSQPQVNLGGHGVFKRDEQTQVRPPALSNAHTER